MKNVSKKRGVFFVNKSKFANQFLQMNYLKNLLRNICLLLLVLSCFQTKGQNNEMFLLPDSLVMLLQKNNTATTERIDALEIVVDALRDDDKDRNALPFMYEILELSDSLNYTYGKALGHYYISTYYGRIGETTKQIENLKLAQNIAMTLKENNKSKELLMRTYLHYSAYYNGINMLPEAFDQVQKGIELNKDVKSTSFYFKLYNNLANIYASMGKLEESNAIFKDMLSQPNISQYYQCWSNFLIGRNYLEKDDDSALFYLEKALQLADWSRKKAAIENVIGIYYFEKNILDSALIYYLNALQILLPQDDELLFASLNVNLSTINYTLKDYDKAIEYVNIGIEKAKETKNYEVTINGLKQKSDILIAQKLYQEALDCMYERDLWIDTLKQVQNIDLVNQMILQKEVKTMETIAKVEKEKQRTTLYFILFFCVLVILIVLLLLNRKSILLKKKKVEEKSLTIELDSRNRELTSNVLSQIQQNELLNDIIRKLSLYNKNPEKTQENILNIIQGLKQTVKENTRQDFDYYFVQVHPNFYNNLKTDFPKLTQYEMRLCAFLRLNLTSKDIAAINNITTDSVKTARKRLRTNLNITDSNVDLVDFLSKY